MGELGPGELEAGDAPMILDVSQRSEYRAGHIKGALNIELGELQEHLDGLPREIPLVTVCAAGMRASMAGGILQRGELAWESQCCSVSVSGRF